MNNYNKGYVRMKKVKIFLTLLTIAIVVAPIAVEVLLYHDNLFGLIVPAQITDIINDEGGGTSIGNGNGLDSLLNSQFEMPQPVGEPQYDPATKTVAYTFSFTNPLPTAVEVDDVRAGIVSHNDGFFIGNMTIDEPLKLDPGQTANITALLILSDDAITYLQTKSETQSSINIDLTDLNVNLAGLQVQLDKQNVGDFDIPSQVFG